MRRVALVAPLLVALVTAPGCGARGDGGEAAEPWPLTLAAPGVLGYVALQVEPVVLADLWEAAVAWRPAGLAPGLPVAVVWLDPQVLGGPAALVLPVADPDAFRDSLEAAPTIESLGEGRYRLELAAMNALVQRGRMFERLLAAGSPLDAIAALGESGAVQQPIVLRFAGDHALLVPSVEAVGVARQVLDGIGGLSAPGDSSAVASFDVLRCRTVYQQQLAALEDKLRALLLGARVGGLAQLAAAMARNEGRRGPDLPLSPEALWALLDMLGPRQVEALQVSFEGFGTNLGAGLSRLAATLAEEGGPGEGAPLSGAGVPGSGRGPEFALPAGSVPSEGLRVRYAAGTRLAELLATTGGAPAQDDAVVLAFDPERLPAAAAEWLRPLAEIAQGKGPPCERFLGELAVLLQPLGGRVVLDLDASPALALGLRPGAQLDVDGLLRWFTTLGEGCGWRGWPDGSAPSAWVPYVSEGMLLLVPREADAEAAAADLGRALALPAEPGGPGLRLRLSWESDLPDLRLSQQVWLDVGMADDELHLQTRFALGAEVAR